MTRKLTYFNKLYFLVTTRNLWLQSRTYDLLDSEITKIMSDDFKNLPNLYSQDHSDNLITTLTVDSSVGLQNLNDLTLKRNRLSEIESGWFKNMKKLTLLDLSNNFLAGVINRTIFAETNVSTLRLSFNKITEISSYAFYNLSKLLELD